MSLGEGANGLLSLFWFNSFITGRNEVVAKVVFTRVCDSVKREGGLPQCMLGYHHRPPLRRPLRKQTPPEVDTPREADNPREVDTPPGSRLRHTVNERPVLILLEYILVDRALEKWQAMQE